MITASVRRLNTAAEFRFSIHARLGGALLLGAMALVLSNCAEKPAGAQLALNTPPIAEASADTTAKKRGGTSKPYVVAGKSYTPQVSPKGYKTEGLASWYGARFHGRSTSNGETFDLTSISAAHPTLPLPSYARVTNVANGRSIVVRVNDRGPFAKSRVVDVSQRTAELLDFRRKGTARVKVEYVGPAPEQAGDQEQLLATYTDKKTTISETLLAMLPDMPSLPSLPDLLPGHAKEAPAKPAEAPAPMVAEVSAPAPAAEAAPAPAAATASTPAAAVAKSRPVAKPTPAPVTEIAEATPAVAAPAETTPDPQIASRIAAGFDGVGTAQPLALNSETLGAPVLGSMGFSAPAFRSTN